MLSMILILMMCWGWHLSWNRWSRWTDWCCNWAWNYRCGVFRGTYRNFSGGRINADRYIYWCRSLTCWWCLSRTNGYRCCWIYWGFCRSRNGWCWSLCRYWGLSWWRDGLYTHLNWSSWTSGTWYWKWYFGWWLSWCCWICWWLYWSLCRCNRLSWISLNYGWASWTTHLNRWRALLTYLSWNFRWWCAWLSSTWEYRAWHSERWLSGGNRYLCRRWWSLSWWALCW